MNNVTSNSYFKNGNYFNDNSMTRERAIQTLASQPVESWLVRPSTKGGSCITYRTLDEKKQDKYVHILPENSSIDAIIQQNRLLNENYFGPQENIFDQEQKKLAVRVVSEQDERVFTVLAKAWLKVIRNDRRQIVAHLREHPQDCSIFYEKLEEVANKIADLIGRGSTKMMSGHKMAAVVTQARETAAVFRLLERSVTIHSLTRDDAILQTPFVLPDYSPMPSEIRSIIHTLLITGFNATRRLNLSVDSLNKLRGFYQGKNQELLYQVLGEAISKFKVDVGSFTNLTDDERKGITPYLTSLKLHVQTGHFETINGAELALFKKYLRECSNISYLSTPSTEELKTLKHPEKVTYLETVVCSSSQTCLQPIDFNTISTFSSLHHLKIGKTFFGYWTEGHLSQIRSPSVKTLELNGRMDSLFTLTKTLVERWLTNLPEMRELLVPKNAYFQVEEGVAEILKSKQILLTVQSLSPN